MENESAIVKKSLTKRIKEFFTAFISLFIKKEKCLDEAKNETYDELIKVNEDYNKLQRAISFEGLKETYDNYKLGVNPTGGLIAIEKSTGYVKEDYDFVCRVRFLSLWRKSAFANLDMKDEESCVKECFSDESKNIYEELKEIMQNQLTTTGNIDTLEVINKMKDSPYKWGRITSRRLFRTQPYAETVANYFRCITPASKKQTKPTYSLLQALYGLDLD